MLHKLLIRSSVGKALEHRSALTPTTAKALIEAGYTVNVERSPERIFDDSEFENIGATLVPENTWREASVDHIIIGLKELPVEECELGPFLLIQLQLIMAMQFLSSTHIYNSPIAINHKVDGIRCSPDSLEVEEHFLISNFLPMIRGAVWLHLDIMLALLGQL